MFKKNISRRVTAVITIRESPSCVHSYLFAVFALPRYSIPVQTGPVTSKKTGRQKWDARDRDAGVTRRRSP